MASHVAHEVRNSLVPLTLYLSLLRRHLAGTAGSHDILDKIEAGFTALEVIVSDLLQFTSHRDPSWQLVRLESLVREVCDSLAPQLAAQGIHAELDVAPQLTVLADRDMLRRATLNLILNALDAMPARRRTGGDRHHRAARRGIGDRRQRAGHRRRRQPAAVRTVLHDQERRHRDWD